MLPLGIGLGVSLVLAGCGSTSKPSFPSLGSHGAPIGPPRPETTPGWEPISGNTFAAGSTMATVSVLAVDPLQLRLRVNATPDVVTQTSYQIHCDQLSSSGQSMRGETPLTREIAIPRGVKSGSQKTVECFVTAHATKPAHASMTLTLLKRLTPAAVHH